MANGYIGKISAVVTANTSDLSAKLRGSVKEVNTFANSLNSSIKAASRSASESLAKIFTPLQQFERKLQTALQLNIRTDKEVAQLQSLKSVVEGINKPLEAASRQFAGLSTQIAGAFLPALTSTQDKVLLVNRAVSETGRVSETSFAVAARAVERTTQAVQRLSEAQQIARSGFSGQELLFTSPQAFGALQSSAAATRRAGELPASALADGRIAEQVRQVQQLRDQITESLAEVEAIRVRPKVDVSELAAAESRLNAIVEAARRAEAELDRAVGATARGFTVADSPRQRGGLGLFGSSAGSDEEQAIARARRVSSEYARLPEAAQAGLAGLAGIASRVSDAVSQGTAGAQQLNQVLDRLSSRVSEASALGEEQAFRRNIAGGSLNIITPAEAAADTVEAQTQALGRKIANSYLNIITPAEAAADTVEAQTQALGRKIANSYLNIITPAEAAADTPDGRARTRRQSAREFLGTTPASLTGVPRELEAVGGRINTLKSQIDSLPASLRSGLIADLRQVQAQFVRVSGSVKPSVTEVERLSQAVDKVAARSRRVDLGNSFRSNFGGAGTSGVAANLNEQALKGYTAQLQLLQNTIGRVSGTARGPAVKAFAALRDAIADAMNRGELETEQTRLRVNRLTKDAVLAAATAAKVSPRGLERQLSRVGDVARGSFSNVGLAVQQAIFAFDDFISVTGGLDQRIRAAGNNISQLGFILGGTAGLITGVVVSAIAQLGAGFIRWYTEADKAEAATKRLNAALESQRSRTEELASAYRDLAESIARAGLSEKERERVSRRDPIRNIEREQEARRRDIATANLPTIGADAARIDAIDKQLEQEANILARRRLTAERNRLSSGVDNRIRAAQGQALEIANTAQRFQGVNAIASLTRGAGGLNQVQRDLRSAERRGDTTAVTRLTTQLAALTVAIQLIRDRGIVSGFERQQTVADTLTRAQSELRGVSGISAADIFGTEITRRLEQLQNNLTSGELDQLEFDRASATLVEYASAVERASIQTGAFARSLSSAAGDLAQAVEQDLVQRSESLRREANAAEARFGADDERTRLLREQQAQVEDARRAATEGRLEITSEIDRRRVEFEQAALTRQTDPATTALAQRIQELETFARSPVSDRQDAGEFFAQVAQRQAAQAEADGLRQQLFQAFESLPDTQRLRRQADELDIAAQVAAQRAARVQEGRQLTLTPAEAAAEEFAEKIAKIREYANEAAADSSGLPADVEVIRNRMNDAIERTFDDQARGLAPAIFGFADSVANALLQGPSRAALNVTDVSSVEGARELNRLLRGDDPARDQNLVELQKQSKSLDELVRLARDNGVQVAN